MIKQLRRNIESIMHEKDGAGEQGLLKSLLYAISVLYGGIQVVRRECYRRGWFKSFKLPCTVISVGNLAVGGTGKTPMTAYLAGTLQEKGQKIVVIKRGYKGMGGNAPLVVSDGQRILIDAEQSGDEAQMLARQLTGVPVLIGADRYQTGRVAINRFQPDVIILDDGFQHIRLQRDLDLVLLDRAGPIGSGHIIPRGILREPVEALRLPDGIILTRSSTPQNTGKGTHGFIPPRMPVFESSHQPYVHYPAHTRNFSLFQNARITAFSGIVRNEDFHRLMTENGAELASIHQFSDHHPYSLRELEHIAASAVETDSDFIVTTEKDFMRLDPDYDWPCDLIVVGVEIDFGEQDAAFRTFLKSCLDR